MSRVSYGTDVFSPIRGNVSLNDDFNDEKDSDYLDLFQTPYDAIEQTGNFEVKGKNSSIPLSKDESSSVASGNLQQTVNAHKKNKKVSSSEDLSRHSYVTTRSRSSHKSEKKLGVIQESRSTHQETISKSKRKNHVTARPEVDLNADLTSGKIKQNKDVTSYVAISDDSNKELPSRITKSSKPPSKEIKDSSSSSSISADSNKELPPMKVKKNKHSELSLALTNSQKELLPRKATQNKDSLASHVEEKSEKKPTFNAHSGSMKSDLNYPGLSEEQLQPRKVLSKSNVMLKKNTSTSKKLENDSNTSTKRCMKIEKPGEKILDKENTGEFQNCKAESSNSVSKPEQIQANIIEKLVKDAVSLEFDGIRQMLYHHQLQILRHMDHNVHCCELQSAFEDLVEENKRLKNLIAQQKT